MEQYFDCGALSQRRTRQIWQDKEALSYVRAYSQYSSTERSLMAQSRSGYYR